MHPQMANVPLQGLDRCALTVRAHIRSPQAAWGPPFAPFHEWWIYIVSKKYSLKADQSKLVSGGSEHA